MKFKTAECIIRSKLSEFVHYHTPCSCNRSRFGIDKCCSLELSTIVHIGLVNYLLILINRCE